MIDKGVFAALVISLIVQAVLLIPYLYRSVVPYTPEDSSIVKFLTSTVAIAPSAGFIVYFLVFLAGCFAATSIRNGVSESFGSIEKDTDSEDENSENSEEEVEDAE